MVSTLISVPCAVSVMTFFQPCMPPALTSSIVLNCKDWRHDGDVGLVVRLVLVVYEFYAWMVIMGVVGIGFYVALLYPVEVKLLILDYIEK